jgi:hypothetical protein
MSFGKPRPDSPVTVTHCREEPEAIDEIVAEGASVHIERMNDGYYWMRINSQTFAISTKKRGKTIITVEA